MQTVFTNAVLLTSEGEIHSKALLVEDTLIAGIVGSEDIPVGATIVDCAGGYILPGLIDLQVYGGGGFLFSEDPSTESLHQIHTALVQGGTTRFVLTLATNSIEVFRKAIRVAKENPLPALLGLHLEGPYLNPIRKGAHIEQYLKTATLEEVQSLLDEAEGVIKIMTLAPELCDPKIIELLVNNGVVVSAGHSNASFEQATAGFKNGIRATTHLFNAMSPLHHRDTGLPGATWLSKDVMASIIPDGIHVDFPALTISKKIMGDRLFIITDAVEENLTGAYVHIKNQDRFSLPDGTLSGSMLTMIKAVNNCVDYAQIPFPEAVRMASAYPAKLMGLKDEGDIKTGYKANLVLMNNERQLKAVYLQGKRVES